MDMSELVKSLHFNNIYFRDRTYKQKDIEVAIDHLARYIDKNLVSPSPFIMLTTYNHIKTIIAYYAILKAGKIVVILDPGARNLELSEMISDVDPAAIILMNSATSSWNYEEEILFRKPDKKFAIHSDLKDVCTIAYTNAEDGFAKGAMLTEKNILTEIHTWAMLEKISHSRTFLPILPIHHIFGLSLGIILPISFGSSVLLTEIDILKLNTLISQIKSLKVTDIYSVPSVYYILSKIVKSKESFDSVIACLSGGTKLPRRVYDLFLKNTGLKIREGYGLTETSPGCTLESIKIESFNSIGKTIPCCDLKIFDDSNYECKTDIIGEICVKGENVFKGYLNNEYATQQYFHKGWFHTGDLGKIDSEGNVIFCGLKKNMINVAGNNIYPKAIERYLLMNENVKYIKIEKEFSEIQGEIAVANILLKDYSKEALDNFKIWTNENITNLKLPRKWNFIND